MDFFLGLFAGQRPARQGEMGGRGGIGRRAGLRSLW